MSDYIYDFLKKTKSKSGTFTFVVKQGNGFLNIYGSVIKYNSLYFGIGYSFTYKKVILVDIEIGEMIGRSENKELLKRDIRSMLSNYIALLKYEVCNKQREINKEKMRDYFKIRYWQIQKCML